MRLLLVGSLVAFCLGCGKSEPPKPAEATSAKPEATKAAPQGAARVAPESTQAPPISTTPVDFETLKTLIPDVDGWVKSDVRGEEVNAPVAHSRAQARYRRNDGRVELEIVDTALSQLLLAPLSVFLASGYAERSDEGFKRAVKVGGQPGIEDWSASSSRGEVTALVANRFVVKAVGHDINAIDPVRKIVEAVDFSTLAAIR